MDDSARIVELELVPISTREFFNRLNQLATLILYYNLSTYMTSLHERLRYLDVDGRQIAATHHVVDEKRIVVFCHGFRGQKLGPNRFFVRLARRLQIAGISSLRFDQSGSGDSEGDFFDSSDVRVISAG